MWNSMFGMSASKRQFLRHRGCRPNLLPVAEIRSAHQTVANAYKNFAMPFNTAVAVLSQSNPITTSKTAFDQLERTDIAHLRLEMSNAGKYVLVRCLEKGFCLLGWHTVVEDHVGNACVLSVYNYPPQELFSPGTVLIVKEPYFKVAADGMNTIRVDSVTDILALRPSHPLFHLSKSVRWVNELKENAHDPLMWRPVPTTALKWKKRGNGFFDTNQLILAREAYFLGLDLCKAEDANIEKLLKLNILACHLELEYYEKAIELGKEILNEFPNEKKALFRMGKAYYAVKKFEEAFQFFERFCQQFPDEKEGADEFRRVQERIKERNGEFDVEKLRRVAKQNPLKEIDCTDYDGPIEIKEIAGRGRGLVLTKDVKKNTVLMVSKALASTLNPLQDESKVYLTGDEDDPEVRDRDGAKVVLKLVHMISKNPNVFGPPVFSLYSGRNSSNASFPLFCDPQLKREPICDMKELGAVYKQNSFRIVNWRNGGGKGMGLFILPSYMNHSCELNVDYKFYNDVMVCTAMADLKAGTELTTSYVNETWDYGMRTMFLNARGFKCDCNRCKRRI